MDKKYGPEWGPFTIARSGLPPLVFEGEAIAGIAVTNAQNDKPHRWHDIVVYRLKDSKYVVRIQYNTTWSNDLNHYEAHVVDSAADVAKVLAAYRPEDHVIGYPPGQQFEKRQAAMLAEVRLRYLGQVSEVLSQRPEFAERI